MSVTTMNGNDLMDDDEGGLSGFTILAILATLIMVFMLVVYYAYRQGVAIGEAGASEELPVVAANPVPVAEDVPLNASADTGRQEVYDRVSGTVPTRVVTAENPAEDALTGYSGPPQQRADEPAQTAALTEEAPARTEPARRDPVRTQPAETRTAAAETTTPARTEPAVTQPAERTPPRPTPAVVATHVVQVGAFDSNKAALDYFDGLSSRLGGLLADKRPDIQQATVNGREYHRLRISPFTSKEAAGSYCSQLKAQGQDCLVRGV